MRDMQAEDESLAQDTIEHPVIADTEIKKGSPALK